MTTTTPAGPGRFLAIVNPAAGGGHCGAHAAAALTRLREAGLGIVEARTAARGEATAIARTAFADGIRDFIAVGGDGTAFEVLNGLFPDCLAAGSRPRLGFLPLGTGNSFVRDFADDGLEHARRALETRALRICDVVRLTHRDGAVFFVNLLCFGFVADVAATTQRRFKRFGRAAYALGVLASLAGLRCTPLPLRRDGGPLETRPRAFVAICNSRYTGGRMLMAPRADTADGHVDVITVGRLGRLALLRTFPRIFDGTHVEHPAVSEHRAARIDFELPCAVDTMVDGEVTTLWPERLDVLPRALDVYVG